MNKKIAFFILLLVFVLQLNAQDNKYIHIPLIGEKAPAFTGQSTQGEISFPYDFGKSWKILFAHPKDFTPVCSSEILELAYQQEEYEKLGVKIIVLSTDILSQHESWVKALEEIRYKDREPVKINFPLVADEKMVIANKYGMIHPYVSIAQNIRGVFIIDPDNIIRAISFYPMQVGRNLDEIKRTILALQTVDASQLVVTPANWNPGDKLMIPVLSKSESETAGETGSAIDEVSWFMRFTE
ncbi:MAG: peroxiredoxin [Bacteroidetes bacterium]|nr:peroxiredoxin [Bacteroidota bacterium]